MFEHLRSDADRLAADAAWSRGERNAHALRGYEILRRRVGSPPGLVVSFGAGVFAGAHSRRREVHRTANERRHDRPPERAESGMERLLHGPIGTAAIKLGTAFLAGALMHPEQEPPL